MGKYDKRIRMENHRIDYFLQTFYQYMDGKCGIHRVQKRAEKLKQAGR